MLYSVVDAVSVKLVTARPAAGTVAVPVSAVLGMLVPVLLKVNVVVVGAAVMVYVPSSAGSKLVTVTRSPAT